MQHSITITSHSVYYVKLDMDRCWSLPFAIQLAHCLLPYCQTRLGFDFPTLASSTSLFSVSAIAACDESSLCEQNRLWLAPLDLYTAAEQFLAGIQCHPHASLLSVSAKGRSATILKTRLLPAAPSGSISSPLNVLADCRQSSSQGLLQALQAFLVDPACR